MVSAFSWTCVALLALGADPTATTVSPGNETAPALTTKQLRDAVHDSLRAEGQAKAEEQESALLRLLVVYQELSRDTLLPVKERNELQSTVRNRLSRRAEALTKQLEREQKKAAQAKTKVNLNDEAILAQRAAIGQGAAGVNIQQGRGGLGQGAGGGMNGAGQGGPNAVTQQNAKQLIDLIQTVIAPKTWDINGGEGKAFFFSNLQVLVILQTEDVHELLGGILHQLQE